MSLLSDAYNAERRKLITDRASLEQRPGNIPGFRQTARRAACRGARAAVVELRRRRADRRPHLDA